MSAIILPHAGEARASSRPELGQPQFGTLWRPLRDNGYAPIPTNGKRPLAKRWQEAFRWSDTKSAKLSAAYSEANVGIVLGDNLLGIDVDVEDPARSEKVLADLNALLPAGCLVRVGRSPRRLILCGLDEAVQSCRIGEVDLLTGRCQFVAYGIHPGTGSPYTWIGDDPLRVPSDCLPRLSPETSKRILAAIAEHAELDCPARVPSSARTETAPKCIPARRPVAGHRNNEVFVALKDFAISNPDDEQLATKANELGAACRPPLPQLEINSILKSVRKLRDEGRLIAKGERKLAIGLDQYAACRSDPRALDLFMWLKFHRPQSGTFTICQLSTAKEMKISPHTLLKAIRHLRKIGLLILESERRPAGWGKRPACLYRFGTYAPHACPVTSIVDSAMPAEAPTA